MWWLSYGSFQLEWAGEKKKKKEVSRKVPFDSFTITVTGQCSAHSNRTHWLAVQSLPWQAWEASTFWTVNGSVPWMPPVVWSSCVINRRRKSDNEAFCVWQLCVIPQNSRNTYLYLFSNKFLQNQKENRHQSMVTLYLPSDRLQNIPFSALKYAPEEKPISSIPSTYKFVVRLSVCIYNLGQNKCNITHS
jgi:hypothetical protein